MNGGLKVDQIGSIGGRIILSDDVDFIGRPYVNSDTAGFAKVLRGARSVRVNFDREYLDQPVVNVSLTFDEGISSEIDKIFNNVQYAVTEKSSRGFTILLSREANDDMSFSWIALAVKNAKVFESEEKNGAAEPVFVPNTEVSLPVIYSENNTTTQTTSSEEGVGFNTMTSTSTVVDLESGLENANEEEGSTTTQEESPSSIEEISTDNAEPTLEHEPTIISEEVEIDTTIVE
jgi:hypothetical protein